MIPRRGSVERTEHDVIVLDSDCDSSPTTNRVQKQQKQSNIDNGQQQQQQPTNNASIPSSPSKKQLCPVCSDFILDSKFDLHVNECLDENFRSSNNKGQKITQGKYETKQQHNSTHHETIVISPSPSPPLSSRSKHESTINSSNASSTFRSISSSSLTPSNIAQQIIDAEHSLANVVDLLSSLNQQTVQQLQRQIHGFRKALETYHRTVDRMLPRVERIDQTVSLSSSSQPLFTPSSSSPVKLRYQSTLSSSLDTPVSMTLNSPSFSSPMIHHYNNSSDQSLHMTDIIDVQEPTMSDEDYVMQLQRKQNDY